MKRILILLTLGLSAPMLIAGAADELAAGFKAPPPETRPGCYWYFLQDDVTEEGITLDLEAMARVGIGRAFIGYINQGANPAGDNQVLTDRWWKRLEHTFAEADRLGVEIGLFNCPGWSQSGGPWITPERSMRNLVNTETRVMGPAEFEGPLPEREGYFETVKVLAFRTPPQEDITMASYGAQVSGPPPGAQPDPFAGGSIGFRAALRGPGDPGNPTGLVRSIKLADEQGGVLLEDDFSAGLAKWRDAAKVEVTAEGLHPMDADNPPLVARKVHMPEKFNLEAKVKLNPGGVLDLVFGYKDGPNQSFWQLRQGMLRPHLKIDNSFIMRDVPVPAIVEDQWITVNIASDGVKVTTLIDGAMVNEIAITEMNKAQDIQALFDNDLATIFTFPAMNAGAAPFVLDFRFAKPFPVQSVIATPTGGNTGLYGALLASDDGREYRKVCDLSMFHGHQGVKITDPIAAAVPSTTALFYRIELTGMAENRAFKELTLSPRAMLDKYVIKQLGDIHPTPHALYGTYEWKTQSEPEFAGSVLPTEGYVDLTSQMDAEGKLRWSVPEGDWTIARFGMVTTGAKNGPAMPDATGLECDKLSAENIRFHFDHYIGEVLRRIPAEKRESFRYIIQDSYETGPQNWTNKLMDTFRERYQYDPTPFLPVTSGRIVGSAEQSERFLWDLRRLVADLMGSEYVGGITEAAKENGLIAWLENYGHWGFPGEALQYGKYSAQIGGEFWLGGDLGTIECRQAASSAHIYGKPEVFAEAFTSGIKYVQTPRSHFKHYGDWAFCEGINHFILHVNIHQPRTDEQPGVDAPFGTNFNRNNTWFNLAEGFMDYTRRVNYMMSRGTNVADVCYFIGEGAPSMDGPREPALPRGYDFDFVNGDVILNRMEARDGYIYIPGGPSYRLMVLPPVDTMRPEIARKLKEFAAAGVLLCGPRPLRSPSLQGYPACDQELAGLTDELWGAGLVKEATGLAELLDTGGVQPDFSYALDDPLLAAKESADKDLTYAAEPKNNSLRFMHRREGDMDIYFVANMHQDHGFDARCVFRVGHKQPEIWDPVSGEVRTADAYTLTGDGVSLPMHFAPQQSFLFVFRTPVEVNGAAVTNEIRMKTLLPVTGPWNVLFDPMRGGPGEVRFDAMASWTDREEAGVKYYSGEAVYDTTFNLGSLPAGRAWLSLGAVADLAQVILNGKDMGFIWVEPWRIEITGALLQGENHLRIKVASTWNNRIFGDQLGEPHFAKLYTPYRSGGLQPAGLLGPVSIEGETAK